MCPLPNEDLPLAAQPELILLACCVFGEARNQPHDAKLAVACVVRNRVQHRAGFGKGYRAVILQTNAFSCFNEHDPNSSKLLRPLAFEHEEVWNACYEAALGVFTGQHADVTNKAVFYHDSTMEQPPKRKDGSCDWGHVEFTVRIGRFKFYRLVPDPAPSSAKAA